MVQANFLREPQFSLRTQWERIFSLFSFRAFCSTWQGLSALPHTRVWQSSGWPCQQLQGCLALSDESVGNLVQYCIGFNLVQYCIGFNLVQYCTGFNLVQYCTGFNLVQYCFVLILKFFQYSFISFYPCPLCVVSLYLLTVTVNHNKTQSRGWVGASSSQHQRSDDSGTYKSEMMHCLLYLYIMWNTM